MGYAEQEAEGYKIQSEIKKLQAENKKLRESVEFYASNKSYDRTGVVVDLMADGEGNPEWFQDMGQRARQCLKELEGNNE